MIIKNKPKSLKFTIILVVIVVATIFILSYLGIVTLRSATGEGSGHSSAVVQWGDIFLYGEEHASEAILEKEFELWSTYYHDDGMRDLFVELPYYSAEYLNLWMQSDTDAILDQLYQDWDGTAIHSQDVIDFYKHIKNECPETIFHGTDVGHQYNTTGERYLAYLRDSGQGDGSEKYRLAQEAIEQGQYYYKHSDEVYRENKMVENFIREFESLNGTNVMGIYGTAHTWIDAKDYLTNTVPCMANQLNEHYGDVLHTKDLTLVENAYKVDMLLIGGKEYTASYFGKTDLSAFFPDYQYREFWRLENAYDDYSKKLFRKRLGGISEYYAAYDIGYRLITHGVQ